MRVCVHLVILTALTVPAASLAGPGWAACFTACCIAAFEAAGVPLAGAALTPTGMGQIAAGVGATGIIATCTALCLCYDQSVSVTTRGGPLRIADVKAGDDVLTLDDVGKEKYTSVLNTFKIYKDSPDTPFVFVDIQTGYTAISVSKTHPVIVKQDGENIVKEAGALKVGDAMVQPGNGTARVTSISSSTAQSKYLIHTRDGTVLANGLLVKTLGAKDHPEHMKAGRLQVGDVRAFVNDFDEHADNELSFGEFLPPALSQSLFASADSNKDIKLSADEIPEFL